MCVRDCLHLGGRTADINLLFLKNYKNIIVFKVPNVYSKAC